MIIRKKNDERGGSSIFLPCILSFVFIILVLVCLGHSSSSSSSLEKRKIIPTTTKSSSSVVGNSTSVFNCGGINGECVYFYPTLFFHPLTGAGKSYRHVLEHIETLRKRHELWPNMPRIGFPTYSFNERDTNRITQQKFNRQNVTFIHVHKAGGTTLHSYATVSARQQNVGITRHYLYQLQQSSSLRETQPEERSKLTYHHLSTAGKYKAHPEGWGKDDHVMFAFIRDPLERFISSIGQAMGAQGSQKNEVGTEFQLACITGSTYSLQNSRDTLQCCIDYIKVKGFYFEVHLTPQAVEIGFATQMYHVPVAVFKFEDSYQTVLKEMGEDPNKKERNGEKEGYRPSPVLTGMTSADYTAELIRQICELYKVDIIMHRSLGWDVPRCIGYV